MHRVGFVTFAGFGSMGLAGLSAFETANLTNGERVYEITLLSETGGLVPCSTGFSVMTEPFTDTVFDTLIVGATPRLDDPMLGVVAFIRQSLKTARRVAGPCTGAFLLAAAGAVDELATAAALSPRQFSRAFRAETGQSPARAIEHLRVEAARVLIEQGRHAVDAIAEQAGFGNRERMRRAFLRTIGQPPQTLRRNSRAM